MLIPGVGVRLPPRAPTGTAARLFPFCLGQTGQNGYFCFFQDEISGDDRYFIFMAILAIPGNFTPDFCRYSVGGRRSEAGKLAVGGREDGVRKRCQGPKPREGPF